MKQKVNNSTSSAYDCKEKEQCLTVFKWISIFFIIYAMPIIIANVLYKDDLRRVLYGDPSTWYRDGRPIMALILKAFSFGTPVFDTSPLPLITGLLFLSFSLTMFYKKYLHDYDTLSAILCLLMFITSPFFLENLSFRFESVGMCISIGLFILLFSLPDDISHPVSLAASMVFTICVSCIYQSTLGTFLALLFVTVFIELKVVPLKISLKKAFYKFTGFCLGTLFYLFCIAPNYVAKDGYQAEHSGLISLSSEGLIKYFSNLKSFLVYLKLMYFPEGNPLVTILSAGVILLTLVAITIYVNSILSAKREKTKTGKVFLAFIAPALILVSAFLPMCVLTNPNYMPRVFLSFNIFLLFIGIMLVSLSKKKRLALFIFVPIYLFSYGFSYTYANLLKSQTEYEAHIAQSIIYDLNKIKGINSSYKFHIEGKKVVAKDVSLATKKYNIFNLMIPIILQKNSVFTGHLLSHHAAYRIDTSPLKKYNPNEYKAIISNSMYRIMQNKKDIVIEFVFK